MANALPANDAQKAIVVGYDKAYKDRFKEDPSTFGGYALDALMLAVDAIKRAGSTDPEKVRTALEQTKSFVGTSGTFNLSPTDHMGLDLTAFRMLEVKSGAVGLSSRAAPYSVVRLAGPQPKIAHRISPATSA